MRLEVRDSGGYQYSIDSVNPEVLGKWLVEIFERIRPGTGVHAPAMVRAWPSWIDGKEVDFVTDSRVLGRMFPALTPREVVAALAQMVKDQEKLTQ